MKELKRTLKRIIRSRRRQRRWSEKPLHHDQPSRKLKSCANTCDKKRAVPCNWNTSNGCISATRIRNEIKFNDLERDRKKEMSYKFSLAFLFRMRT